MAVEELDVIFGGAAPAEEPAGEEKEEKTGEEQEEKEEKAGEEKAGEEKSAEEKSEEEKSGESEEKEEKKEEPEDKTDWKKRNDDTLRAFNESRDENGRLRTERDVQQGEIETLQGTVKKLNRELFPDDADREDALEAE